MHKIYTCGYAGAKPADIRAHVERLDATLVDIRYSAWSRVPHWRPAPLRDLVGFNNYLHIPELGNVNYRGGPIRLSNPTVAIPIIQEELMERPIILLCACEDWQTCHRRDAADYLSVALGVDVEHLTPDDTPAPGPDHTMKALSLTQPWASLLVGGYKRIETRSRQTHYRGTVAIHASKGFPQEARDLYDTNWRYRNALRSIPNTIRSDRVDSLPLGAILGTIDIMDCVRTETIVDTLSADERAFGDYAPRRWAWICENPVRFDEPIPATGALGLWNWQVPEGLLV